MDGWETSTRTSDGVLWIVTRVESQYAYRVICEVGRFRLRADADHESHLVRVSRALNAGMQAHNEAMREDRPELGSGPPVVLDAYTHADLVSAAEADFDRFCSDFEGMGLPAGWTKRGVTMRHSAVKCSVSRHAGRTVVSVRAGQVSHRNTAEAVRLALAIATPAEQAVLDAVDSSAGEA